MTKKHSEPIDRKNPAFFVFLVDQSGSMHLPFDGQSGTSKAQGVADAINRIIQELVFRCSRGDEILDRYFLSLIGYNSSINRGFGGALQGQAHVPVSEVGNNPLRVETRPKKVDDGAGGILETTARFQVWVDPVAQGKTKMREALEIAKETVAFFVKSYPESYPPIVINITDGLPTDASKPTFPEAVAAAKSLRSIANKNGSNTLLFNVHISSQKAQPILFPKDEKQLTDPFSRLLFHLSSPLTDEMCRIANASPSGIDLRPGARGFVYQGDLVSVIQLLNIGTRVGINR